MNVKNIIIETIIEQVGIEDYTVDNFPVDKDLFGDEGVGLDSLAALEIIAGLSKKFKIPFNNLADNDMKNINSLELYIRKELNL